MASTTGQYRSGVDVYGTKRREGKKCCQKRRLRTKIRNYPFRQQVRQCFTFSTTGASPRRNRVNDTRQMVLQATRYESGIAID